MFIPVFNNVQFVERSGYLTQPMQDYNDLLNQSLRKGLSDNGWTLPQITHDNLVKVQADGVTLFWQTMPDGTSWYETTNNVIVVKINNALRKVDTSVYP